MLARRMNFHCRDRSVECWQIISYYRCRLSLEFQLLVFTDADFGLELKKSVIGLATTVPLTQAITYHRRGKYYPPKNFLSGINNYPPKNFLSGINMGNSWVKMTFLNSWNLGHTSGVSQTIYWTQFLTYPNYCWNSVGITKPLFTCFTCSQN